MTAALLKTSHSGRPVTLTVRRPGLSPTSSDRAYFFDNDPWSSLFFAAFSIALPEGERYFIHAIRHFQDRISDPALREEVRAFIGQEAHHGTEHDRMNQLFADAGFDVEGIKSRMQKMVAGWKDNLSPKQQLAQTVCTEHFTALLSDYMMRVAPERIDQLEGNMQTLWAWHAIEEAEHKAVAFDVYQELVNEPLRLRLTMVLVTLHMLSFNGYNAWQLIREAGETRNLKSLWKTTKLMLGRRGMVTGLVKEYLDFYRPGFHPWQHDNRRELEQWRQRFLGEAEIS